MMNLSKSVGQKVTLSRFILNLKYFICNYILFYFVLELSDALVAIEFGSIRIEEFRSIVNHNINYLAMNAHG